MRAGRVERWLLHEAMQYHALCALMPSRDGSVVEAEPAAAEGINVFAAFSLNDAVAIPAQEALLRAADPTISEAATRELISARDGSIFSYIARGGSGGGGGGAEAFLLNVPD